MTHGTEPTGKPAPRRIIRWEAPPPARSRVVGGAEFEAEWTAVAEQLRKRIGRWAVIFKGSRPQATAVAQKIKDGRSAPFGRGFEASLRVTGEDVDECELYTRYLGDVARLQQQP